MHFPYISSSGERYQELRKLIVVCVPQLQLMRKGAADPAAVQGLLASVTGQAPLYDSQISNELEENKLLLARFEFQYDSYYCQSN